MSNIAPNTTCGLASTRIWMCRLNFDPPQRKPHRKSHKDSSLGSSKTPEPKQEDSSSETSIFDAYMDGLHLTPLDSAYVLLIKIAGCDESIPPDPANAMFCRTAKDGELLTISEGQINSDVPPSNASTWQLFQPNDEMVCFWTLSVKRFKRVVQEARQDFEQAKRTYDFERFRVVQERLHEDSESEFSFELIEDTETLVPLLRHALVPIDPSAAAPGYFYGGDLLSRPEEWNSKIEQYPNYVLARRRVADAIYSGELIQYHALGLRQRSAKEFATFAHVQDICRKTKNHERATEIDNAAVNEDYRDIWYEYAYACANDIRIERGLFKTAVTVMGSDFGWQQAATQITNINSGCVHPDAVLTRRGIQWRDRHMDSDKIMQYFDFYRFGALPRIQAAVISTARAETNVMDAVKRIRTKVLHLLGGFHYYDVLVCYSNYEHGNTLDRAIHERYLELSADVQNHWWEKFDPENGPSGEKLKQFLEDAGSFLDKAPEMYADHLGSVETIEKYNEMLASNEARAHRMFRKLADWNKLLYGDEGDTVSLNRGTFTLTASASTGIVTLKDGDRIVSEMRLIITDVKEVNREVEQPRLKSGAQKKRMKVVMEYHARYDLELKEPFHSIKQWPRWLSVIGLAISTCISVMEAREKLTEKLGDIGTVVAVTRAAKDTFEIIDGFSAALHNCLPYAKKGGAVLKFAELGEKVAGPGFVLEAILNVHDGMQILLFDENSLSENARERGATVEVELQLVRGWLLVMSPVLGVQAGGTALAIGLSTTVAFEAALAALCFSLAAAAILIVAIEIAVYVNDGFSSGMTDLDEEHQKAQQKEFSGGGNHRTFDSLQRFSKTADILTKKPAQESVWQTSTQ
jgi:hypothetical protein